MPVPPEGYAAIDTSFRSYSPIVYFHPDKQYLPSSINLFFASGALVFHKGEESRPVAFDPMGSNLPRVAQITTPTGWTSQLIPGRKNKSRGDLTRSQAYIKPMYGMTFTDIAVWLFYPFSRPAKAKVDWEHVTPGISNFDGEYLAVFFSQCGTAPG
ncbi:hypothetical protein MLD38_020817 [Melastoma candidum]|uniref:Uncharacterized protein n=1 Tax=Melastoma candidum TaxID=119954 RepID=A0ACB9QFD4_9MYRT|nr:hypothetical protein MLD38_020817 [Melastoma candidum]